ncbi:Arm DNA-binding domain-containing protein [Salicibibacter kimchii]|uniref:AP2-like integrase N-terminal domain-containing protein n=1 Tax=Salicibibacter kimchii TaxID=2099786 RepID=A0A345C0M6_9BACI|nr:Arm DNA-binding domain-containing protein [Salicibibacter kimchii]AXF56757.1 hypothetical protein DT065_12560 [Salicibibacter kimchii]
MKQQRYSGYKTKKLAEKAMSNILNDVKEVRGSLFKMSDKDEEIMLKSDEDFYILKYNEIFFAAVNVS